MDQFLDSPLDGYVEAYEEFVKLVNAEQDARLAKRRFVEVLDRMCELVVGVGPETSEKTTELDYDAHYREAYADDEPSMRIKRLNEMWQGVQSRLNPV